MNFIFENQCQVPGCKRISSIRKYIIDVFFYGLFFVVEYWSGFKVGFGNFETSFNIPKLFIFVNYL